MVALIITIIVLLILAVVAINAVQDDGIIEYAKNARDDYQKAQTNESTLLGNYTNYIKENIATVKIITFTIGGITYQAEEGMTWLEWTNSEYNTVVESDSRIMSVGKCSDVSSVITALDSYAFTRILRFNGENVIGKDAILKGGVYDWYATGGGLED